LVRVLVAVVVVTPVQVVTVPKAVFMVAVAVVVDFQTAMAVQERRDLLS
jgi:hypothetical protein